MNEAIMAVIIASTAFSGLSAVVIGQINASKLHSRWKGAQTLLVTSGGLGVLAAVLGSVWFMESIFNRDKTMGLIVFLCFVFQLLLFWSAASSFWQFGEKKNK